MKKFILLALVLVTLASCTNQQGGAQYLESQGYTNVEMGGHDFLLAVKGDLSTTHFKAMKDGKAVEGAIAEKVFVGWRIRTSLLDKWW